MNQTHHSPQAEIISVEFDDRSSDTAKARKRVAHLENVQPSSANRGRRGATTRFPSRRRLFSQRLTRRVCAAARPAFP